MIKEADKVHKQEEFLLALNRFEFKQTNFLEDYAKYQVSINERLATIQTHIVMLREDNAAQQRLRRERVFYENKVQNQPQQQQQPPQFVQNVTIIQQSQPGQTSVQQHQQQ